MSAARIVNLAGLLGDAIAVWATRDEAKARPGVRQSANDALAAVDDMLSAMFASADVRPMCARERS